MPKKKVTEAVEETAQETIPVEKAPGQMPRRQGSEDLLELNDLERGVTCEDTVSFRVTRVDEENGIALGFITRIIKRHTRLR